MLFMLFNFSRRLHRERYKTNVCFTFFNFSLSLHKTQYKKHMLLLIGLFGVLLQGCNWFIGLWSFEGPFIALCLYNPLEEPDIALTP